MECCTRTIFGIPEWQYYDENLHAHSAGALMVRIGFGGWLIVCLCFGTLRTNIIYECFRLLYRDHIATPHLAKLSPTTCSKTLNPKTLKPKP